ncbi:hypothetical protein IFR05_017537, partial [Cadophora sp. M221]
YIVADKYRVPALKLYAADKFFAVSKVRRYEMKEFSDAFSLLWGNITSANDTIMKRVLGKIVFLSLDKMMECGEIETRMPDADNLGSFVIDAAQN